MTAAKASTRGPPRPVSPSPAVYLVVGRRWPRQRIAASRHSGLGCMSPAEGVHDHAGVVLQCCLRFDGGILPSLAACARIQRTRIECIGQEKRAAPFDFYSLQRSRCTSSGTWFIGSRKQQKTCCAAGSSEPARFCYHRSEAWLRKNSVRYASGGAGAPCSSGVSREKRPLVARYLPQHPGPAQRWSVITVSAYVF